MKRPGPFARSLVLAAGLALGGCQKDPEPPRHPAAPPVQSPPGTAAGMSALPPPPPLPAPTPPPEDPQEVIGPKDLMRSAPTGSRRQEPRPGREAARPATAPAPGPPAGRKEPAKVQEPVKPVETIPPVKEKKKEIFEPLKPPHFMPGA